ncbi:hypothetical protein [uncultured Desulfosarcina sp.]|uniref:hypothetical protein n=1 Tax=uncultured Desulfosarcina sp. TaxID=218289 RepID=UPI0029C6440A|nr:hypothetical protein [uncultured Desulfosarcina sp.]
MMPVLNRTATYNLATVNPASTHEVEERLQFERLLTEIYAEFINLPIDRGDAAIEKAQYSNTVAVERVRDGFSWELSCLIDPSWIC